MPLRSRFPKQVRVFEVGPRDGLQNHPATFSVEQKLEMICRLAASGIRDIEIGSFVHPKWVPQMAGTDDLARRLPDLPGVRYWALVPNEKGFERACEACIGRVAVVLSASESHNRRNLNRTRAQSIESIAGIVRAAAGQGVPIRAYVSTAFGCPYEGAVDPEEVLRIVRELLDIGAEEISLGDTIGMAGPRQVRSLCTRAIALTGSDRLAIHLHDTRGLGLANAYAALEAGVSVIDASIGGMGGCPYAPGASGNIATEDLVNLLETAEVETGIDLDRLVAITRWLREELDVEPSSRFFAFAAASCPR
jgi:hydroxymethylglutaryl-CoA lyase